MAIPVPTKNFLSKYIDASGTNIPTSYGSGSDSKIMTGMANTGYRHLRVLNKTAGRVALCFVADKNASVPSSSNSANTAQHYVPEPSSGNTTVDFVDEICVFDSLYIRSDSGSAITSGVVVVELW